jgi:LysR family glycine cleavage system transcriptional activator
MPLCAGRLVPVCAPALLGRRQRVSSAQELAKLPLLHDMSAQYWGRFFRAHGARVEQSRSIRVYDDSNVVLQLAIEGEGVALQSPLLVHDDVAAGRLVVPGDLGMGCELSFHLAFPAGSAHDPALARILRWLQAEAAASMS